MRSHNYIYKGALGVYSEDLLLVIQLEKIKSGNMYTGEYFGFTANEDTKLFILCNLIALKISELSKYTKCIKLTKKNKSLVNHITSLASEKFYPSLLVHIQNAMPDYFSFSKVYVLLYIRESKRND